MLGSGSVPSLDSIVRSRFIKGGHFVAMKSCEVFISCDIMSASHMVDLCLVGPLLVKLFSCFLTLLGASYKIMMVIQF